jgi:hypothetical protein
MSYNNKTRFQHIAVYYPENHETPGYQIVTTPDVIKAELTLQQNGFVSCPVHGGAWALPGSITVHDGIRKQVVSTAVGFALHRIKSPAAERGAR